MLDKEFEQAIRKVIEYHNVIVKYSNEEKEIPADLEKEIIHFVGTEFPKVFLKAPAIQASAFLDATVANMPMPYVCNLMSGIVCYYIGEKVKEELGELSSLDYLSIRDKLK